MELIKTKFINLQWNNCAKKRRNGDFVKENK